MTHTSSADGPEFSGEHFREIVQAAIDAAITMNFDGTVLNWNDAAATLLGWSSKEAIGSSLAKLIVPERNRKLLADRLADCVLD